MSGQGMHDQHEGFRISEQAYSWKSIRIGGGGFVTGIIHNPSEKDLVYLRTDVGGAYRLDPAGQSWLALQDGLGPEDWNLHGIESLATDPLDTDRVYLAAGTYTNPKTGFGAILRSCDRGQSWQRTDLPFRLGGNEAGRGSGERLAVDPLDNRRLWFGTRRDGLWESLDQGLTWHGHPGFGPVEDGSKGQVSEPGKWNFLAQAVGIIQVLFDPQGGQIPGGGCRTAWLAVSRHQDGLFVTRDGGQSFQPVPGQPGGLRPTCLSLGRDRILYVSYSRDPGPNHMGPGAVWKLDTLTGSWTDITPEAGVDGLAEYGHAFVQSMTFPTGEELLLCTTWYRSPMDEIFLSADRGQTWKPVLEHAVWDHDHAPYARNMRHHWLADAALDPFNPGRVIFTTGYGIFTCPDVRPGLEGRQTSWIFDNRGIEETVPLALLSPATSAGSPRLVSGLGDIDGFVHHDLDRSPVQGRFDQPGFKNTECLAAAGLVPGTLVRSGTTYRHDRVHGAWSTDGGQSWQALATQPPVSGQDRPAMGGPICVSADGTRVVWSVLRQRPWFTDDRGQSWKPCEGLDRFIRVVADPSRPEHFLAWDTADGTLWESTDRAASFAVLARGLPVRENTWGPEEGDLTFCPTGRGMLLLSARHELWISRDQGITWEPLKGLQVWAFGLGAGPAGPGPATVVKDSTGASGNTSIYVQGRIFGTLAGTVGTPDAPDWHEGTFRSDDGLETWYRIASPGDGGMGFPTLRLITGDQVIHGRCYVGTGGRGILWGQPV